MPGRTIRAAIEVLERERIDYALIGAMAMASHGAPRNTHDVDLLVSDEAVLQDTIWESARRVVRVDVRLGDEEDPLVGLIRLGTERSRCPVDVVVPRGAWLSDVVERARVSGKVGVVDGLELPLVTLPDLVLLKADATGTIDLLDIQLLLETWPERRDELVAYVDVHRRVLDDYSAARWDRLVHGRDGA